MTEPLARLPSLQDLFDNLIATLAEGTERAVGDHVAPVTVAKDSDYPFLIVYHLPGGDFWGAPLSSNPDANVDVAVQLSSVGRRRDQAQALLDRALRVMLERDATGAFRRPVIGVADVVPQGGLGGVEREGAAPNAVYTATARLLLRCMGTTLEL